MVKRGKSRLSVRSRVTAIEADTFLGKEVLTILTKGTV